MNITDFRAQFPEFAFVDNTMVQAYLDAATLEIDPDVYRLKADQAQAYLAAHKMALSPAGMQARLTIKVSTKGSASTTYWEHFDAIRKAVTCGLNRVT